MNFEYMRSQKLCGLPFCRDELAMALVKNDISRVENAEKILKISAEHLKKSQEDYSRPLMENSEKVIAETTYQKNNLTENYEVEMRAEDSWHRSLFIIFKLFLHSLKRNL